MKAISKQPSASVIFEQLGITDITPQGVHRLVSGYVHHFENGRAVAGAAG